MLKSPILFSKTVATLYGNVTFNAEGVAEDLTLNVEEQKALATLPYINYTEDKKLSPKPEPVKEPEPKEDEPKAEVPKPKRTRAKAKPKTEE